MKFIPCPRNKTKGGFVLLLIIAVAIAVVLVVGAWIVLEVVSLVNRINNKDHHAGLMQESFPHGKLALAAVIGDPNMTNIDVMAAPPVQSITVLESTNLEVWTRSELSATEVLYNLNNRINLTNNACFYRILYE